ncbi:cobalamin-dependent protein [bacterium]|nr:cobalamin-dependent protein [candidate division CSSED10-310 bacterium]
MKRRRIKRVMLINPPNIVWKGQDRKRVDLPIGLAYLASVLQMEKFDVLGVDTLLEGFEEEHEAKDGRVRFGLSDAQIKTRIRDFNPDVVGVSSMFSKSFNLAVHMCRLAREVNPEIITVLGGNHASTLPEQCLRRSDGTLDFVVIGEGEFTTGLLLRGIANGYDLRRINGIAFLDEAGDAVINRPLEPIQNVDILPWPNRNMFNIMDYSRIAKPHGDDLKHTPYTTFISSRGCPFKCNFCAAYNVHGRKYRPRNPKDVLDELEFLVERYGLREVHWEDDNLTADRERALAIFNGMIERRLNLSWATPNGIAFYTLDREVIEKMVESGCYSVWASVETGDEESLKRMGKPTPMQAFRDYIPIFKELGIPVKGTFLYGFPWETREHIENTFRFARELDLDYVVFYIATPLPGTELWDMSLESNPELASPDFDWEKLQFGLSNMEVNGISKEEIQQMRKKFWLKVNWDLDEDQEAPDGM